MKRCPRCGSEARDDDAFCEADGARLVPLGSATVVGACAGCGLAAADAGDGYCSACGARLVAPVAHADVLAVECASAAAATDRGLRHDHNQDAIAIADGAAGDEPWTVLVVCDGVSSSTRAEEASAIAARVTCDALAHFARSGDIAHEAVAGAMAAAIRAAHTAICAQRIDAAGGDPPGTTLVAALVHRRQVTVGWVGDSRAYWVAPAGAELLTRDHSWVNDAVASGEMSEPEALRQPMAHAITRCLGPLEVGESLAEVDPDVKVRTLTSPGHLVLCTDGLWNYFPRPDDVATLVRAAGAGATPSAIAKALVGSALVRGGQDNIAVAVHAYL